MPEISADLQALLDRVAEGAARACGAVDVTLRLIEDHQLHRVAHFGPLTMWNELVPLLKFRLLTEPPPWPNSAAYEFVRMVTS